MSPILLLRAAQHSLLCASLLSIALVAAACGGDGVRNPRDGGDQPELDGGAQTGDHDASSELDASDDNDADTEVRDAGADGGHADDAGQQAHEGGPIDAGAGDAGTQGELAVRIGAESASTRLTQVRVGPTGDLFLVGSTNGEVNPGGRRGLMDALVVRMHADGRVVWVRQLGDVGIPPGLVVKAWDAELTDQGELIVVGLVNGRPSFQGQALNSTFTAFVAAFGAEGEQRWLRLLSGTDGTSEAMGVEVLQDGRIAVAGYTKSSDLHGAASLGAGDVFVVWLSAAGEVQQARRYGAASEEYPTAFTARGDELYLAYKTAPVGEPASALTLVRLSSAGEVQAAQEVEQPRLREIAALAPIDTGVCAALHLLSVTEDGRSTTEYGMRCYDQALHETRSLRGGTPGGRAVVQSLACERDGRCALAGYVDGWFEGEALEGAVEGFALGFGPDDARLFARRFHASVAPDQDSVVRAAALASAGAGRFVLAGDTNGELFGAPLGSLDGFVTRVE